MAEKTEEEKEALLLGGEEEAEASFAETEAARARAKLAAQNIATVFGQGGAAVDASTEEGKRVLRARGADALASALGISSRAPAGGAQLAATRQTALSTGLREAEFGSEQATKKQAANELAAQAAFDAEIAQQEIGTAAEGRVEKDAAYSANVQAIKDSTGSAQRRGELIRNMVQFETDPVLKAKYESMADEQLTLGKAQGASGGVKKLLNFGF